MPGNNFRNLNTKYFANLNLKAGTVKFRVVTFLTVCRKTAKEKLESTMSFFYRKTEQKFLGGTEGEVWYLEECPWVDLAAFAPFSD